MKILILIACLIWSTFAFANKGVSGGNGAGGTLLDPQTYEQGTRLDGSVVETTMATELPEIARAFPLFTRLISELATGSHLKYWYLEDRALNPACLNPITLSAAQEILACQNAVEVRIKKSWWESASPKDRAALLLHEILTALRFSDGRFETVPMATGLLLNPRFDAIAVADELGRLRFPNFLTASDVTIAAQELVPLVTHLCQADSDDDHKKADAGFNDSWSAAHITSYRAIQAVTDTQIFLREMRIDGFPTCGMTTAHIESLIESAWIRKALN